MPQTHWTKISSNSSANTTSPSSPRPGGAEQRRHARQPANWPASVYQGRNLICETTVIDVSIGGLGLATELPGKINDRYSVTLPGIGTFACRFAWTDGTNSGIELLAESDSFTDEDIAEVGQLFKP